MKSDRTLIIVIAAVLLVLCSVVSCLVGLAAGSALSLLTVRSELRTDEWPKMMTPEVRRVPEMMGAAALVTGVDKGSPAEKAGIEAGNIILAIDGQDLGSNQNLSRLLNRFEPGDDVSLTIWDGADEIDVVVTLGEWPDGGDRPYLGLEYQMIPSPLE